MYIELRTFANAHKCHQILRRLNTKLSPINNALWSLSGVNSKLISLVCSFAMLSRFARSGIFPLEPISLLLCAHRDGKPPRSMVIWKAFNNCTGIC